MLLCVRQWGPLLLEIADVDPCFLETEWEIGVSGFRVLLSCGCLQHICLKEIRGSKVCVYGRAAQCCSHKWGQYLTYSYSLCCVTSDPTQGPKPPHFIFPSTPQPGALEELLPVLWALVLQGRLGGRSEDFGLQCEWTGSRGSTCSLGPLVGKRLGSEDGAERPILKMLPRSGNVSQGFLLSFLV